MYARGINDDALEVGTDRFVQECELQHAQSVRTHQHRRFVDGDDNLEEARFLCIRRANDISQVKGFVPSPDVGKHGDPVFGTHHARDAYHLFRTKGLELNLWSSALKLNTSICTAYIPVEAEEGGHERRDHGQVQGGRSHKPHAEACQPARSSPSGRDHGYFGRILNQTSSRGAGSGSSQKAMT